MPKPEYVTHSKFPVEEVIFNDGEFSIAYGEWNGERECIGMRWDGEGDDPGYPKLFSNPVWFVLPKELSIPILVTLIEKKGANNSGIMHILSRLLKNDRI